MICGKAHDGTLYFFHVEGALRLSVHASGFSGNTGVSVLNQFYPVTNHSRRTMNDSRFMNAIQILPRLLTEWGLPLMLPTRDRHVLQNVIFPYFQMLPEYEKILFIGCEWYTSGYLRIFRNKSYWTMDRDPQKKNFGSTHHISDFMENMNLYFNKNTLDLIICNGVFGWGLDEKEMIERAFNHCYHCLRPGGILILGWNDIPSRRPVPLSQIAALLLFQEFLFPPLSSVHFRVSGRRKHTYSFFRKSPSGKDTG